MSLTVSVDLQNTGDTQRDRETKHINKDNCAINTLVQHRAERGSVGFGPIRESPVLRILHKAVTGDAPLAIVAHLGSEPQDAPNSKLTLNFAMHASKLTQRRIPKHQGGQAAHQNGNLNRVCLHHG